MFRKQKRDAIFFPFSCAHGTNVVTKKVKFTCFVNCRIDTDDPFIALINVTALIFYSEPEFALFVEDYILQRVVRDHFQEGAVRLNHHLTNT